jgi:hypothetical protein
MHMVASLFFSERRRVKDVFPDEPWVGYTDPLRYEDGRGMRPVRRHVGRDHPPTKLKNTFCSNLGTGSLDFRLSYIMYGNARRGELVRLKAEEKM